METWQLLTILTGFLLLYALSSAILGFDLGAGDVVFGVVFGGIGIYLGDKLSKRMDADDGEE